MECAKLARPTPTRATWRKILVTRRHERDTFVTVTTRRTTDDDQSRDLLYTHLHVGLEEFVNTLSLGVQKKAPLLSPTAGAFWLVTGLLSALGVKVCRPDTDTPARFDLLRMVVHIN